MKGRDFPFVFFADSDRAIRVGCIKDTPNIAAENASEPRQFRGGRRSSEPRPEGGTWYGHDWQDSFHSWVGFRMTSTRRR